MEPTELLLFAARGFDTLGVNYAVVGSMASSYFGEARLTNDVDILAALQLIHIEPLLEYFPQDDFYISEHAVREAIKSHGQFNVIHPESGLKLDVMISDTIEYDATRLTRRINVAIGGSNASAFFASPEDIIIKKMVFYLEGGSEKHL